MQKRHPFEQIISLAFIYFLKTFEKDSPVYLTCVLIQKNNLKLMRHNIHHSIISIIILSNDTLDYVFTPVKK